VFYALSTFVSAQLSKQVSGKTDYLVIGDRLADGRPAEEGSKYKKAVEKKVITCTLLTNCGQYRVVVPLHE